MAKEISKARINQYIQNFGENKKAIDEYNEAIKQGAFPQFPTLKGNFTADEMMQINLIIPNMSDKKEATSETDTDEKKEPTNTEDNDSGFIPTIN